MEIESLASLLTSSFALIAFFYMYFKETADIKTRLTALETKVQPFWNWVDKELPKILHSPHTPEFDKLLEKYEDASDEMTLDELTRLECILREEISKTAKEKILLYVLMLGSLNSYIDTKLGKK